MKCLLRHHLRIEVRFLMISAQWMKPLVTNRFFCAGIFLSMILWCSLSLSLYYYYYITIYCMSDFRTATPGWSLESSAQAPDALKGLKRSHCTTSPGPIPVASCHQRSSPTRHQWALWREKRINEEDHVPQLHTRLAISWRHSLHTKSWNLNYTPEK